jgi:cytochrome P450
MPEFDPFSEELAESPLEYLRGFLATGPLHPCKGRTAWLAVDYATTSAVLRSPQFSTDSRARLRRVFGDVPYVEHIDYNMFFRDGDEHRRLRSFFSPEFGPKAIRRLADDIAPVAEDFVARLDPDGFDLGPELATPLPIAVISQLLGIGDGSALLHWSRSMVDALEFTAGADQIAAASRTTVEMKAELTQVLARLDAGTNPLHDIRRRERGDDRLADLELVHNGIFLLAAAHETTATLIACGLHAVASAPGQQRRLTDDWSLLPNAIEELARFVTPIQMVARRALADVTVGDHTFAEGDTVFLAIVAANRDPTVFAEPDVIEIERPNSSQHLGFGQGVHLCLGAPLARVIATAAFTALYGRFGALEPAGPLARHRGAVVHPVHSAPMRASRLAVG